MYFIENIKNDLATGLDKLTDSCKIKKPENMNTTILVDRE